MTTSKVNMRWLLLRGSAPGGRFSRDGDEPWGLERSAAHEGAVDVWLLDEHGRVVGLDAAAVEDAQGLGRLLGGDLGDDPAQVAVDFRGLGGRGVDTGADRPHGLVGQDGAGDLVCRESGPSRAQLTLHHSEGEPLAPLFSGLADAEQRDQAMAKGRRHLPVDLLVRLAEDAPALRVPEDDEAAAQLGQHARRDFARKGALVLPVTVLGAPADGRAVNT